MWLKKNQSMSTKEAYNKAVREFYKLRSYQHVARETAIEEARMFGAVFMPGKIEAGLIEEAKHLRKFKEEAFTRLARTEFENKK